MPPQHNMAAGEYGLSQELARIIACQYPASLMTLADILAHANDSIIRTCIHRLLPCAIIRLASIVAAALPLWSYSLQILHALCRAPEFTAVLLKDHPTLLDALLAKANTSHRDFDEYSETCVLLLSRPLPPSSPLPGSAQTFFLHLFERAAKTPNVETLRPVYSCLNGACRGLLGLLSAESRQSFDLELRQILQSSSTGQDSMLLLWCFGIVILSEHPHDVGTTSFTLKQGTVSEKQWKTASWRKLFGSPKSISTAINLTYLSVIWASKGEVGVSDSQAVEGIRIATRAMHFVPREVREEWPKLNNLTKNTAAKLVTKILRRDIDPGVQLEALSFFATMVGEQNLPAEIISQYEVALLKVKALNTDINCLKETLFQSLPLFASHLRESTIRQLFADIMSASSIASETCEMWNLLALSEVLTAIIPKCAALCSQVTAALSSSELQDGIQQFLQVPPSHEVSGTKQDCDASLRLLRQSLQSSTISMLLTAVVAANSPGTGLSQELALALIRKQQMLTESPRDCNHASPRAQAKVSLFEQGCSQSPDGSQKDWRDQLKSELARQNSYQQDTVIRSVAQICQDLEIRCKNVEEPLRREQEKVKDLTTEVSQLREHMQSLETEAIDRQLYADGFEAELANVENERQELANRLAELQSDLAQANQDADESLRAAQEQFNARELELRSKILMQEEDLHSQARTIENSNARVTSLEGKLQDERAEKDSLHEQYATLKADFDTAQHDLQSAHQSIAQQADKLGQLEVSKASAVDRLAETKKGLDAAIDQRNELQAQLQEVVQSCEQAMKELRARHANEIDMAALKADQEHAQLRTELQAAIAGREHAKTTYEDARRDLERAHNCIHALDEKIQQLNDTCAEKVAELQELQFWKSGVLQSMGLPIDSILPTKAGHCPSTQSGSQKSIRQLRLHKSTTQVTNASAAAAKRGISDAGLEDITNESLSSGDASEENGSTPKRLKPRRGFKVPDMHTPYSRRSELIHKPAFKESFQSKRKALGAVSPNRRHTTIGFAIAENEKSDDQDVNGKRRSRLQLDGQDSFDMDSLLAGTPFTPGKFDTSTQRQPGEETGEQMTEL